MASPHFPLTRRKSEVVLTRVSSFTNIVKKVAGGWSDDQDIANRRLNSAGYMKQQKSTIGRSGGMLRDLDPELGSLLVEAAIRRDNNTIKMLVKGSAHERIPSSDLHEALLTVVKDENEKGVDILLKIPRVGPGRKENEILIAACSKGNETIVQKLLEQGGKRVDPSARMCKALRKAAMNDHLHIVQLLLRDPRVDPTLSDCLTFRLAASRGNVEIVEYLLQFCDPSCYMNQAVRDASLNGHDDVLKLLLSDSRVNPSVLENQALTNAASKGHTQVVKLLLSDERVDPSVNDFLPIRRAIKFGHHSLAKMLIKHANADPVLFEQDFKDYLTNKKKPSSPSTSKMCKIQ